MGQYLSPYSILLVVDSEADQIYFLCVCSYLLHGDEKIINEEFDILKAKLLGAPYPTSVVSVLANSK